MKGLAITVVVLVVLLAVGVLVDGEVTEQAERRAAEQVRGELDAASTAVDLQGWPVSLRLLFGTVPRIEVVAHDVPIPDQPASLDDLDVVLSDADLRLGSLGESDIPVRARTGTFTATLSGDDVYALAGSPPVVERVELVDGVLRFVLAGGVGALDVVATLRGDELVLQARDTVFDVPPARIPLTGLPAGARVESYTIEDGLITLRGTVRDVLLEAPG